MARRVIGRTVNPGGSRGEAGVALLDPPENDAKVTAVTASGGASEPFLHLLNDSIAKMANGEIPAKLSGSFDGSFEAIKTNLNSFIDNFNALVLDQKRLADAVAAEEYSTRIDTASHKGEFSRITGRLNATVESLVDKSNWYKAIVDAVPFPVHVTDTNMKWTFMNKAFEKLMVEQGYVADRDVAVGLDCCTANANICNTDKCGIKQLRKGVPESYFDWVGGSKCKQDTSELLNAKGEKIGYVEVVQDLSSIIGVKDYTQKEVDRLAGNLLKLAQGNLNFDLNLPAGGKFTGEVREQFGKINQTLERVQKAVAGMITDVDHLVSEAKAERFDTRAQDTKHEGDFRKVVAGVNQTLDVVVDKLSWYKAIIDAVPFPVHVTDMQMKWTFMNKAFEKLMVEQGYVADREVAVGLDCCTANANICNTDKCGIKQLQKGIPESYFDWVGGSKCKQDTSELLNAKGVKIGYVEVVQDLSSIIGVKDYTHHEVDRLAGNLVKLAQGDLDFDLKVSEADHFTGEAKEQFTKISHSLSQVQTAVKEMAADVNKLASAAVEGTLSTRADAARHGGDFRKIVDGFNRTMDAMVEPLNETSAVIAKIAAKDLTAKVQGKYTGDYLTIKENLNRMADDLRESMRQIASAASILASSSEQLTATSTQMAGNAEETATQAGVVSSASDQVSRNVSIVAASAEEMQASIREIAKNSSDSARVAKTAVTAAESTNVRITKLGESSIQIGKVIKVITSIAQQTNLLALNATIEAARAGEAGKGFAVVANEVKDLAKETAHATEEIGQKIEAIQTDTKGAVEAIGEITNIINQINDISNSIASALEEQTVTTAEIGRNVGEAAKGTGEIAQNIQTVSVAAQNTTRGATDVQQSAGSLSEMAARLQTLVGTFKL